MNFKKLTPTAIEPKKETSGSAGLDLYADLESNILIYPGETRMISTGISAEIPQGYFGGIYARSSFGTKKGLRPANCVGVIDSDYRGDIIVAIHNDSAKKQLIRAHERIAQMIIQPALDVTLHEVDELSETERGSGGFGSTGTN